MDLYRVITAVRDGLLLTLLAFSLLRCGDPGCGAQSGFDRCQEAGNASGAHELLSAAGEECGAEGSCCCVCHVPMIPAERFDGRHALTPVIASILRSELSPTHPTFSIFRPPRA